MLILGEYKFIELKLSLKIEQTIKNSEPCVIFLCRSAVAI